MFCPAEVDIISSQDFERQKYIKIVNIALKS